MNNLLQINDNNQEQKKAFLGYLAHHFFHLLKEQNLFFSVKQLQGQYWIYYDGYLNGKFMQMDSMEKIERMLVNHDAYIELPEKIFTSLVDSLNRQMLVDAPDSVRKQACVNTELWLKRSFPVSDIGLSSVEKVLFYAKEKNNSTAIYDILSLCPFSFGRLKKMSAASLNNIMDICCEMLSEDKAIEALNHFFNHHYVNDAKVELLIRDVLLKKFPEKISEFYPLPCIEKYIMQYNDDNVFIETDEICSLAMVIDCKKIYNYLDIPSLGLKESQQILELMADALKKTVNITHVQDVIIHHHQLKDENGKKEYQHSHMVVNITAQYGATIQSIDKNLLNSWIKQMLSFIKDDSMMLKDMLSQNNSKPFKSFLFSMLLEKKLDNDSSNEENESSSLSLTRIKI
jgi:hypothetical protein